MAKTRRLFEIAQDVRSDWKNPHVAAIPYLEAMGCLTTIDGQYGSDSARSIVRYFLGNAGFWRGEVARRIKAELREML